MFENIMRIFKKGNKKEALGPSSKETAKERLHLVLMQDRANVSADFLDLMRQEIIEVIKKYIEIDEKDIDVRLTNQNNEDGTQGAPALYANIPILNIKEYNKITEEKNKDIEKIKNEESEIKENIAPANEETKKDKKEEQKDEKEQEQKKEEVIENQQKENSEKTNNIESKNEKEEKSKTEKINENTNNQKKNNKKKKNKQKN